MTRLACLVPLLFLLGCVELNDPPRHADDSGRCKDAYKPAMCVDVQPVCSFDKKTGCEVCTCNSRSPSGGFP